jgi:hypothetical protein
VRATPGAAGAAAEEALLQRAAASAPNQAPAPQFFTKRVADPGMIPMLVAAGVEFGAVKVRRLFSGTLSGCVAWPRACAHLLQPVAQAKRGMRIPHACGGREEP